MFMHLNRVRALEGHAPEFRAFFEERVLPLFETAEGCLFVSLLQQSYTPEEFLGMSIWDSVESADRFQRDRTYRQLLAESSRLPLALAEWRVNLSNDPDETADMGLKEPPGDSFRVEAAESDGILSGQDAAQLYVRIVAVKVREGRVEEFKRLFRHTVIPALKARGCREVFLVEGQQRTDDFLSLTLWNREEDAVRYEISGEFERLTEKLKDTLSEMHRWKLSLSQGGEDELSRGLQVRGYHLVAGKRL